jgi:hypothetical protein
VGNLNYPLGSSQYKVNLGHKPSGILDNEQIKEMVLDTR